MASPLQLLRAVASAHAEHRRVPCNRGRMQRREAREKSISTLRTQRTFNENTIVRPVRGADTAVKHERAFMRHEGMHELSTVDD
jgi:hypothetical protein